MKKVIPNNSDHNIRIPIKLWLNNMEDGALEQAKNLARLPFAFKHIAIMPDSHQGYGMPIGGVLATKRAVIPNAVGVDIGCGMCMTRTNLKEINTSDLKKIMGIVRKTVPVGYKHHNERQDLQWMPTKVNNAPISMQEFERACYQIGTLGGGNHFIEIQKGSDDRIWIMIHSGSRNIGYTVAKHYHEKAKEICNKWFSEVPDDLAFFPLDDDLFARYMNEMQYCIDFAFSNRKLMMERVKEAFVSVLHTEFDEFINKPHNFASWEKHFNESVIVHRKGATRAEEGELGMIPGSQGSNSYIVIGKGNEMSFKSCSHGAGRTMSRTQAKKELSLEDEIKNLEDLGVLHTIRGREDLDEAPSSYKDINEVMTNQKDLVEIKVQLKPLATIKG